MSLSSDARTERPWWVYVLTANAVRRTYVGSTNDPLRRLRQHNGLLRGGASATRAHRPWRLALAIGPLAGRAEAQRIEWDLKQERGLARLARRATAPGEVELPRMPARMRATINRAARRELPASLRPT